MKIRKQITIQDSGDNLERYFREIRLYEPLTKEQERELIIAIQEKKDPRALDKLIKHNLKFVVSVAKHYQGQGTSLLDLISQGNEGMIEAAYRFNVKENIKFFSYALWWIRIKIFTTLDLHKRSIQLPANRELLITKVRKEAMVLEQKLERTPTIEELTDHINSLNLKKQHSTDDIYEAIAYGGVSRSLQDKLKIGEEEESFENIIAGEMRIDDIDREKSLQSDLNKFLTQITQVEYDILVLSLGLNGERSYRSDDIAKKLKLKLKDVVRLKHHAIRKLKRFTNINLLKEYL